jgi:hypothetical protein
MYNLLTDQPAPAPRVCIDYLMIEAARRFCELFPEPGESNILTELNLDTREVYVTDGTNEVTYGFAELES